MRRKTRHTRQKILSGVRAADSFIWPLGKSPDTPVEMNTSFGPRIDVDRWDFPGGIDLPAAIGTPVHAMADAIVHRAGLASLTIPHNRWGMTTFCRSLIGRRRLRSAGVGTTGIACKVRVCINTTEAIWNLAV
jgi:hypothetical protein